MWWEITDTNGRRHIVNPAQIEEVLLPKEGNTVEIIFQSGRHAVVNSEAWDKRRAIDPMQFAVGV